MAPDRWVFLNGDFLPEKQAKVSINDRGFLFGDGIFTTMRVHAGVCELYNGHLRRLEAQAEALDFIFPPLDFHSVQELIQRNQAWTGTWRLKIIATATHEGEARTIGNLLMTLHPYQGNAQSHSKLSLFPHPLTRPLAHIKSLSYLDYLYVREYAKKQGCDDALITTNEGILLETSCANLFWIDQRGCWIPDFQLPYLKGVFLQAILSYLPLRLHYVKATFDQLPSDASVYICNSLAHVRPVVAIDEVHFSRDLEKEELLAFATFRAVQNG